ncbi:MAG TPA: bifunctional oligoribonuclease/PAP phosphatase NrnA [Bacillota bacterium]|nr:bifunctional oligoribonuclease/PAP phosphatase NrnA [Bacillota bacterium]
MNNMAEIAEAIKRSQNVLICGHITPDGDSLGSILALGLSLEKLGKKVTMAGPDPVPAIYDFLPGASRFRTGSPPEDKFDTLIVLDCSVPERLGEGYRELLERDLVVINIDHHAGSVSFGTYRYVDRLTASVGEIIFELLDMLGIEITLEAAICLYTAIVTDTGSFQFENTTPDTHRRVARLLEIGVPAARINVKLYEEKPRESVLLLGAALNTLSFSPCGKVCWMTVDRELIKKSGAEDEHTEGLVNYARSIRGVLVGLLFHEISENKYKISFRSKEPLDVNKIAAVFGGGGHSKAAGCVLQGDLREIQEKVVAAALSAIGGNGL